MTDAQTWLNRTIPVNQRTDIRELYIWPDDGLQNRHQDNENKYYVPFELSLTRTLDLSTFPNLEKLKVEKQFISRLVLTNCYLLKELNASDNLLREIIWPTWTLELAPRLESIDLTNNNFLPQNLSEFNRFHRLKVLFLGTDDRERIRQNIYNRWNGSLICIRNLDQLQELDINATDIDDGLIDLPMGELFHFTFGNYGRTGARVDRLKTILARDLELGEEENIEEWATGGTYNDGNHDRYANKVENIRDWQVTQRQQGEQQKQQLQAQIQINNFNS